MVSHSWSPLSVMMAVFMFSQLGASRWKGPPEEDVLDLVCLNTAACNGANSIGTQCFSPIESNATLFQSGQWDRSLVTPEKYSKVQSCICNGQYFDALQSCEDCLISHGTFPTSVEVYGPYKHASEISVSYCASMVSSETRPPADGFLEPATRWRQDIPLGGLVTSTITEEGKPQTTEYISYASPWGSGSIPTWHWSTQTQAAETTTTKLTPTAEATSKTPGSTTATQSTSQPPKKSHGISLRSNGRNNLVVSLSVLLHVVISSNVLFSSGNS